MIEKLRQIINESENIVFFGGAGVSTESNIPDFRSETGIYNTLKNYGYPPETLLSHSFFTRSPKQFYEYYKNNLILRDAEPNAAHYALAEMERRAKVSAVITQNIDGLHQKAGSKNVIELHGSVYRNYCIQCRKTFSLDYVMESQDVIPSCSHCGGIVRPDVVLYEEELDMAVIHHAIKSISMADVLIIGGTSLVVYPAAGLVQYFKGKKLVLINKSATQYDSKADLVINDSIGKILGSLV
ncbi:MAG: NAD-dependent protein deacylase [Clostridia bacterium]|nr:NAD-dependent protein deacylase [Clostridia bacterium]